MPLLSREVEAPERTEAVKRHDVSTSKRPHAGRALILLAAAIGAVWPAVTLAATPRPRWHPGPPYSPVTNPATGEMHQISDLFWIMLVISGIVFVGVAGALIISIVRFSSKPGRPEPTQVFGNRPVEILWTIIPAIILAVAFGATVKAMRDINAPTGGVFDVIAVGHQWWWEFQYPSYHLVTANELHVPTGVTIHFHVESYDVIHSFWAPQLQRQIDANPGQDNPVFVKFSRPGVYAGACYEYCGTAHAWMKFVTVVQSPAQFQAWVRYQVRPAAKPTGVAALGQKVFLSNTCVDCHAVLGTPAGGAVGPNLTHLASRWTVGAGAAPMTQQDIERWVQDPTAYKPGVLMPGYPFLSKKQLHELGVYLYSLK